MGRMKRKAFPRLLPVVGTDVEGVPEAIRDGVEGRIARPGDPLDLAKSIGRAFGEFKRATSELKESLDIDESFQDVTKPFDDIHDDIANSILFLASDDAAYITGSTLCVSGGSYMH